MPTYKQVSETKPTGLVKQKFVFNDRRAVTCPNCGNKTNLPGRGHEMVSCHTCHHIFPNTDYTGY